MPVAGSHPANSAAPDYVVRRPYLKTFFASDSSQRRDHGVIGVNKAACRTPATQDLNDRGRRCGDGIGQLVGKLCKHVPIIANVVVQ